MALIPEPQPVVEPDQEWPVGIAEGDVDDLAEMTGERGGSPANANDVPDLKRGKPAESSTVPDKVLKS